MNTPQPISAYTLKALVQKLRPSRFPGMTSAMAAMVGFVLGARFCDRLIAEIRITTDGSVFARATGEPDGNHFVGNYADLLRDWLGLIAAAGLSRRELIEAQCLFAFRVGFFGRPNA